MKEAPQKKPFILAALPAFNEETSIGSVILRTKPHVSQVVVVDDGSHDRTEMVSKLAGARVLRHSRNKGYGGAIKSCFKTASKLSADVLIILDSDGQHSPEDIPIMIKPILDGKADIVIGSRFLTKGDDEEVPGYRKAGIRTITRATDLNGKMNITDAQSGFRAYSKDAIHSIFFNSNGMGASAEILIDASSKKLRIKEIPIKIRYDGLDSSTHSPAKHGLSVIGTIVGALETRHPLMFFGIIGMVALLIGLYFGIRAFNLYSASPENIFPIGTGLVSIFFILVGFLAVVLAFILNAINHMAQRIEKRL